MSPSAAPPTDHARPVMASRPGTGPGAVHSPSRRQIGADVLVDEGRDAFVSGYLRRHQSSGLLQQVIRSSQFQGDAVWVSEVEVVPHLHVTNRGVDDAMTVETQLPFF